MFFIFHLKFIIFHDSIAFGVNVYKYILHPVCMYSHTLCVNLSSQIENGYLHENKP